MDTIDVPIMNLFSLAANQVICRTSCIVNKDGEDKLKDSDFDISLNDIAIIAGHINTKVKELNSNEDYTFPIFSFEEISDYCDLEILEKRLDSTRGVVFHIKKEFIEKLNKTAMDVPFDEEDGYRPAIDTIFGSRPIFENQAFKSGVKDSMVDYICYGPDTNEPLEFSPYIDPTTIQ